MMIPKDAKIVESKHLAEGEHTGHFHRATAKTAKVYDVGGGVLVLDAPRGTKVEHQEHGTVAVPPGEYDRLLVQEFDPFAEEIRAVQD
jgi:hypothetical protein